MLTVITAPSVEPITLAEAKSHCRIDADISEHDDILNLLIQSARELAEHETGRALITQTLQLLEPAIVSRFKLRKPPFIAITSVVAIDSLGAETALAPTDYYVDSARLMPELVIKAMPAGAVLIKAQYTAGYGSASQAVPAAIRRWILMHVNTQFEHRESVVVGTISAQMPTPFIEGQLDPYRVHSGF